MPNVLTKAVAVLARGLGLTDPRLYHYFSAGPTYAGENVTIETSMQLDAVSACVRLISETIATLPLLTFTRDTDGHGIFNKDHPLYRLLHDQPNADMTAVEFWTASVAAILLWGNSYAAITRKNDGPKIASLISDDNPVTALTPMRPDRVTVRRREDGSLQYYYSFQGLTIELEEWQVLHIKGFSLDGLMGIAPITQARQTIATAMAAEKAAGSLFRNGLRPSAVMESPVFLTEPQREIAKGMIERFSGALNAGSVPLLEGGWKLNTQSIPPGDAQLLASRMFSIEQIARWFMVPPPMIGHMEKSTAWGTGLEQMMQWFLMFSLRPHLERIEQAVSRSLLTPAQRLDSYVEFSVEGLLRGDSRARSELYKTQIAYGLKTPNEIRALENDPPDPDGNDLMVQSSMLPIKLLGEFVRGRPDTPLSPNFKPDGPTPAAAAGENNVQP